MYSTNRCDRMDGKAQYEDVNPQFDITRFDVYGMESSDNVIKKFVDV